MRITASSAFSGRQAASKVGVCYLVGKRDRGDLRKFIDAQRANRNSETSKEPLSKFSFLLIDIQQCTVVCFVQCFRQVIQNLPNIDRKSATQNVDLADDPPKPKRDHVSVHKTRDETCDHLHAIRFSR